MAPRPRLHEEAPVHGPILRGSRAWTTKEAPVHGPTVAVCRTTLQCMDHTEEEAPVHGPPCLAP